MPVRNRALGRIRVALLLALLGLMVAFSRPTPTGVALGSLVAFAGEAIRVWAAGYLDKTVKLALSGPYRHTRNPLYLGRLLIFTGLCLMARLPYGAHYLALLAGYLAFFGYYLPRKERVEPARLTEVHGDKYRRYHAEVPALFPALRPCALGGGQSWSAARMVRNREHWMVVGVVALSLYLFWRAHSA